MERRENDCKGQGCYATKHLGPFREILRFAQDDEWNWFDRPQWGQNRFSRRVSR